jgi:flagellar motility protein MotE (MotC chaperone)
MKPALPVAMLWLGLAGCRHEARAATPDAGHAPAPEVKPEAETRTAAAPPAPDPLAAEERAVLLRLRQRHSELEARARELDAREQEVRKIEQSATALLDRVEQANARMEARLGIGRGQEEARAAQVQKLGETLRTLKPKQAAELLLGMDPATAKPLLRALAPQDVARLMSSLRAEEAANIAALLVDPPPTAEAPSATKEKAVDQGS